jgi:hypothetical protein
MPVTRPPTVITDLTKKIIPTLGTGAFDVNALPMIQRVNVPPTINPVVTPAIKPTVGPPVVTTTTVPTTTIDVGVTVKPKKVPGLKSVKEIGTLQPPPEFNTYPVPYRGQWHTNVRGYRNLVRHTKSILRAYPVDVLSEKIRTDYGHVVTTYAQVAAFIINNIITKPDFKFDMSPPINWYRLFTKDNPTTRRHDTFEIQDIALPDSSLQSLYHLMGGPDIKGGIDMEQWLKDHPHTLTEQQLAQQSQQIEHFNTNTIMKQWLTDHPYIFTEQQLRQFDYLNLYIIMKQAMITVTPGNDASPETLINNYKQHYTKLGVALPTSPVIQVAEPVTTPIATNAPPKPPTIVIPGWDLGAIPWVRKGTGPTIVQPTAINTGLIRPGIQPILPVPGRPVIQSVVPTGTRPIIQPVLPVGARPTIQVVTQPPTHITIQPVLPVGARPVTQPPTHITIQPVLPVGVRPVIQPILPVGARPVIKPGVPTDKPQTGGAVQPDVTTTPPLTIGLLGLPIAPNPVKYELGPGGVQAVKPPNRVVIIPEPEHDNNRIVIGNMHGIGTGVDLTGRPRSPVKYEPAPAAVQPIKPPNQPTIVPVQPVQAPKPTTVTAEVPKIQPIKPILPGGKGPLPQPANPIMPIKQPTGVTGKPILPGGNKFGVTPVQPILPIRPGVQPIRPVVGPPQVITNLTVGGTLGIQPIPVTNLLPGGNPVIKPILPIRPGIQPIKPNIQPGRPVIPIPILATGAKPGTGTGLTPGGIKPTGINPLTPGGRPAIQPIATLATNPATVAANALQNKGLIRLSGNLNWKFATPEYTKQIRGDNYLDNLYYNVASFVAEIVGMFRTFAIIVVKGFEYTPLDLIMYSNNPVTAERICDSILTQFGLNKFTGTLEEKVQFIWWMWRFGVNKFSSEYTDAASLDLPTLLKMVPPDYDPSYAKDRISLIWSICTGYQPITFSVQDMTTMLGLVNNDGITILKAYEIIRFGQGGYRDEWDLYANYSPLRYLTLLPKQEYSKTFAFAIQIDNVGTDKIAQSMEENGKGKRLMVFPPNVTTPATKRRYLLENIIEYTRIFTRGTNGTFDTDNLPANINTMTTDAIIDFLSFFTDGELNIFFGFTFVWTSRKDLIAKIAALPRKPEGYLWSITGNLPSCLNYNVYNNTTKALEPRVTAYLEQLTTEDPTDPVLYYGGWRNIRGYQTSELSGSITKNAEGVWGFSNPSFNANGIDKLRDFTMASARQLRTLLEPMTGGVIKELYNKLVDMINGTDNDTGADVNRIKKIYGGMTDISKSHFAGFIVRMFFVGMYSRYWKGPGNDYPTLWSEDAAIKGDTIRATPHQRGENISATTIEYRELLAGDQIPQDVKDLVDSLCTYKYDYRSKEYGKSGLAVNQFFILTDSGKFCAAHGADVALSSATFYALEILGLTYATFNDYINSTIRFMKGHETDKPIIYDPFKISTTGHYDPDNGYLADKVTKALAKK